MARVLVQTDNFNRASLGANWAQLAPVNGNIAIFSSTYVSGGNGGPDDSRQSARWVGSGTFTADQYSELAISNLSDLNTDYGMGVICRASADTDAGRDYYEAVVLATVGASTRTVRLGKYVNGTYTQLNSATMAWANGDRIGLECEGTTIRATKNGVALGGSYTQTDTSLSSGQPGVSGAGSDIIHGDDWEAGNMAAPLPVAWLKA